MSPKTSRDGMIGSDPVYIMVPLRSDVHPAVSKGSYSTLNSHCQSQRERTGSLQDGVQKAKKSTDPSFVENSGLQTFWTVTL